MRCVLICLCCCLLPIAGTTADGPLEHVQQALTDEADRVAWQDLKHKVIDGVSTRVEPDSGEPYTGWVEKVSKDGVRRSFLAMQAGRLHGPGVTWSSEGAIDEVSNYHLGHLAGKSIRYYADGSVREVTVHSDAGTPESFTRWDEQGALVASGTFTESNGMFTPKKDATPQERSDRPEALRSE